MKGTWKKDPEAEIRVENHLLFSLKKGPKKWRRLICMQRHVTNLFHLRLVSVILSYLSLV